MTRAAIEEYVYLLDEAFFGDAHNRQSMLGNLATVTLEDWLWTPPNGARTIRAITAHVGSTLYLYYDRAFGGGEVFGDPPTTWNVPAGDLGLGTEDLQTYDTLDNEPPMAVVVAWVTGRHQAFRDAVASLDDTALSEVRMNHRGVPHQMRWFISTMLQHYSYHAGEINHIRALHQGDDGTA